MEPRSEESHVLVDLGLTTTQARAYLALCRFGACQPTVISKESMIARQDVYRVLLSLQELGLIEKVLGNPALFSPIPLRDAIDILMGQRAKKSRELYEETEQLLHNYSKNVDRGVSNVKAPQFVLVPQGRAGMMRGKSAIMSARKSIDCVTSGDSFMHMIFAVGEELVNALRRGVECRFLLGKPENGDVFSKTVRDLCQRPGCRIEYLVNLPEAFVTSFDNEGLLIATSEKGRFLQTSMLWSNDPPLLSMAHHYFETLWIEAFKDLSALSRQNPFDVESQL